MSHIESGNEDAQAGSIELPSFRPHPMVKNCHWQTILGAYLLRKQNPYSAIQHHVELDDGDQLVVHDDCPKGWTAGDYTTVLVHGLGGCHSSPYMIRVAEKLNDIGVRTFRMDMRGCGAGIEMAVHPFHAGRSNDLRRVVEFVRGNCPDSPVAAIGFSLGANLVTKLVGEIGQRGGELLDSAFAVAPPVDLRECSKAIGRGWNKIYDRTFLRSLNRIRLQRAKAGRDAGRADKSARSLYEFDDFYTAPVSGFKSAEHYYEMSSSAHLLSEVRVPTMVLTSRDDPLIPFHIFESAPRSKFVQLFATEHGGHLGFLARRSDDNDRRWMDWRIVDWIEHRRVTLSKQVIGERLISTEARDA
jgi:predicted alpha/beta-fold hydrolase